MDWPRKLPTNCTALEKFQAIAEKVKPMFEIRMEMKGDVDPDKFEVEIECPRCSFLNPVSLKQARLRDVVICRGCKANMQLDDGMNTVRNARHNVQRQMGSLRDQIDSINRMFR
jgi:hypothetical protein